MVKQVLPVIALSEDSSWMFEMFRDLWTHQIEALQPNYELKYVTKKQEAKQLLSSGSVRACLALDHLVAAVVKECGFLEVRRELGVGRWEGVGRRVHQIAALQPKYELK